MVFQNGCVIHSEAEMALSIHINQQFTFGITLLKCDMSPLLYRNCILLPDVI